MSEEPTNVEVKSILLPELKRRAAASNQTDLTVKMAKIDKYLSKLKRVDCKRDTEISLQIEKYNAMEAKLDGLRCIFQNQIKALEQRGHFIDRLSYLIDRENEVLVKTAEEMDENVIGFAKQCLQNMLQHDDKNLNNSVKDIMMEKEALEKELERTTKILDEKRKIGIKCIDLNSGVKAIIMPGSNTFEQLEMTRNLKGITDNLKLVKEVLSPELEEFRKLEKEG